MINKHYRKMVLYILGVDILLVVLNSWYHLPLMDGVSWVPWIIIGLSIIFFKLQVNKWIRWGLCLLIFGFYIRFFVADMDWIYAVFGALISTGITEYFFKMLQDDD